MPTTTPPFTEAVIVDATENLRQRLIHEAAEAHAEYPQYDGYWNGWLVAYAKRTLKHRGQIVAEKGDPALFDPASVKPNDDPFARPSTQGKVFLTVYLPRNCGGMNTSWQAKDWQVAG